MRKIINVVLTLAILILPFIADIQIVDAKILKYGDIDENGVINSSDRTIMEEFINNTKTPTSIQKALADINKDDNIDSKDLFLINDIINKSGAEYIDGYRKGDVNMNGIIDPSDKEIISHRIANRITLGSLQEQLADTDNSGGIGAQDLNYIHANINQSLLTYKLNLNLNEGWNPDFSASSSDNGLFVQVGDDTKTENGLPVHYYRGAVENNYVKFGNILFRIISVNPDGSIKIISEDTKEINIDKTVWNSKNISKYINDDGSNSEIKTALDSWYNTTIKTNKSLDNKIQNSDFCNDIRDIDFTQVTSSLGGKARLRIINKKPAFICYEGAIIDNNKVGLITADEVMYAGGLYGEVVENNTTYLDNGKYFWTLTPEIQNYIFVYSPSEKRLIEYGVSNENFYARPVMILKPDTMVIGNGNGTKDNPYVIDTSENNTIIMNTINEVEENIITTNVLNDAKENLKTITYETYNTNSDNGNFKYSWTINPENITEIKDINTTITTKDSVSTTDGEVYNRMKYALKNNDVRYVTLKQTGDLGLTSIIKLDVSDKYTDGNNVWIYRWDDTKRRYEEISNSTVENGQVSFNITKGDNYIISESNLSSIIENPPTGMIMFVVIGIIGLLLIGSITYLIYSKKNNKFLKA